MSKIEVQHGRALTPTEKEVMMHAMDILRRLDKAAEFLGWRRTSWGRDAYQTGLEALDTVVFIHAEREQAQGEPL